MTLQTAKIQSEVFKLPELKDRIKLLREEKGLTQKQLAKILGFAESTIGCYETGKRHPDYELVINLANYFNTTVDYLLCRTNTRKESPYPVIATGNEKFSFHKSVPLEAREEIINFAEYTIKKHEEKIKKGK